MKEKKNAFVLEVPHSESKQILKTGIYYVSYCTSAKLIQLLTSVRKLEVSNTLITRNQANNMRGRKETI